MCRGRQHMVVVAAACLTVLAAGAFDVRGAAANPPAGPQLVRVSGPSVNLAGPDQTLTWSLQTSSGDGRPILGASLSFTLDDGYRTSPESPPTVTATLVSSQQTDSSGGESLVLRGSTGHYQAGGHYSLGHVYLGDTSGTSIDYLRDSSGDSSTVSASPADDGPSLRPADFNLANPQGDGTAPVISRIALRTPSNVSPGEPVVLAYTASDDSSGVDTVSGTYDQAGDGQLGLQPLKGSASTGPLTSSIPGYGNNGVWELASLTVTDRAGNTRVYRRGDPSLDLSVADLTVSGVVPDTLAPVLTSLTTAAAPTAPGGWMGFGYTSTDDASGVANVRGFYSDPDGHFGQVLVGNACADPTQGVAGQPVAFATEPGIWTLQEVIVSDQLNHQTIYDRSGGVRQIPADPSGASAPSFDLSVGDVVMTGSAPHQSAPRTPCSPGTAITATSSVDAVIGTVTHAGVPVVDPVLGTYASTSNGLLLTSLTTGNSAGAFSAPPLPAGYVSVVVHFFGGRDRAGKNAQPADATPSVAKQLGKKLGTARLTIKRTHTTRGKIRKLKLSVSATPGGRGNVILLQKPHGRSWMTVARARLDSHQRLTLTISVPRSRLRFFLPATATHTATAVLIKPSLLR